MHDTDSSAHCYDHAKIEVEHLLVGLISSLIERLGLYGVAPDIGVERLLAQPLWVYSDTGSAVTAAC